MAENLRVTKYNDGTIIPEITDGATWTNLNSEAWCWYNNSNSYDIPYGKLYNWHAVNNNNICPIGWHVPTDQEWSEIVEYFDPANFDNTSLTESSTAGGLMKQTGLINWSSPNTGATNTKGLTLIAGGYRSSPSFFELGERGIYWSSTEESPTKAWCRWFYNFLEVVDKWNFTKNQGLSIRCVKD